MGGSAASLGRSYALLFLAGVALKALADCECGYMVDGNRYTNAIINDFSKFPDLENIRDGSGNELDDWEVQEWKSPKNEHPESDEFRLQRQNLGENVWIEGGMLHLRQRGYSEKEEKKEVAVKVAEIVTRRDDIFYGSFRSNFRVIKEPDSTGGSVAGFFFYYSDTAETDIEILTRHDTHTVHYSQQPTYNWTSDEFNDNASITTKLKKPWTEFQEHRWDWKPEVTTFFQDGEAVLDLQINTPNHEGKIMMNLWADDGNWSGPPSNKDVNLEVKYFHFYFNVSHENSDAEFLSACEAAGGFSNARATCNVDEGEGKNHTEQEKGAAARISAALGISNQWPLLVLVSSMLMVSGIIPLI